MTGWKAIDPSREDDVDRTDCRLLGPMEVRLDGRQLRLPGAAEQSLLALLLLSPGRAVAATSLVDQLWIEETLPLDPLNALQTRVSKLRRALSKQGLDVVRRAGAGYLAEVDPDSIDIHRFGRSVRAGRAATAASAGVATIEALSAYDEALALWRGDPLADFVTETWATVEAARLNQLRLAAVAERAEVALGLGRHVDVVTDLEPLVAQDPKHEGLAALLMTALFRSNRQADALEVYSRTRSVLDDELGLEPSAALRALHQRVLQQDPALAELPGRPLPAGPAGTADRVPAQRAAQAGNPLADVVDATAMETNVPAAVGRLVGRDAELASLPDMLRSTRMLSLVGPGGAGKTALAFGLAAQLMSSYADGVWVARLAPVTDPADVPLAVADALGVPLDGGAQGNQARSRLISYLARREVLLVLDNCEHVVDSAARLVDEILARCPEVSVLATSREALAIRGEMQVAVAPLDVPPEGTPPGQVLDYPAARLFVDRARAVRADLPLGDDELAAIARVCVGLDGMPLALELAAARVSSLSVPELAERLQDRFTVLTAGPRTSDARQRTLRATVDWSHALLSEPEKTLFRRLAIFHGGWTLAAAAAVASGNGVAREQVLDLLGRLVDRSMVIAEPGHPTRYRMLETLRQYAAEQLDLSDEREALADRHALFFRSLADEAEQSLRGSGQRTWLRRLRDEQPNLRAALSWVTADPARVEEALHLAGALGWFWHLGRHVEGREVLRRIVSTPGGSPAARARALQAVSLVERPRACLVHPSPRCADTARQSLELFATLGDAHRAALSQVMLAVEGVNGSRAEESERLLREAEEQFTREDDTWGHAVIAFVRMETFLKTGEAERAMATGRAAAAAFRVLDDPWGLSAVLYHMGWGLRQFGRYAEAVPVLEEAIEVANSAGLYNTVQWALADLGLALVHLGQSDAARDCFDRARAASQEIGDGAGEVLAAGGEAVLARISQDWSRARDLYSRAAAGFRTLGTPVAAGLALCGVARCDEHDGMLDAARSTYEEALELGRNAGEPSLTASALEGLARIAALEGNDVEAAALSEQAAAVRALAGRPASPHEQVEAAAVSAVS